MYIIIYRDEFRDDDTFDKYVKLVMPKAKPSNVDRLKVILDPKYHPDKECG